MPFCGKCGSSISDGVAFCPNCGAPAGPVMAGGPVVAPVSGPALAPAAPALRENVASFLCYLLGWITGIVFFLIDKRPLVRFHAAQSIVVFGGLFLLRVVLSFGFLSYHGFFSIWSLLSLLVGLLTLVLWIVLMVTAYQGKRLEIPIAAEIAKNLAGRASV